MYELRLTGVQSRSLTANQTSCRSELCDESFSLNFSGKRANVTGYNLSLRARNNIGSSEAVMYQLSKLCVLLSNLDTVLIFSGKFCA